MFDSEAVTLSHELIGPSSYTLVSGTGVKYILGVSVQQSGVASVSDLKCGTTIVVRNYGKDFPYNDLQYRCEDDLIISKTGNDDSSFLVTYLPRDLALEKTATNTGTLVEFGRQTAIGMQGLGYVMFFGFALTLMIQAILFGTWLFKKRL